MLLPEDFVGRVIQFASGRLEFPFIRRDELMCMMFLYGRRKGVPEPEIGDVAALAERTASQITGDIERQAAKSSNLSDSIRSRIVGRQLQMAVDSKGALSDPERVAADPSVIMEVFSAHVSHFSQGFCFELYGPLRESELSKDVLAALIGRMVMVGYNRHSVSDTGLQHPMVPVYLWFMDHAGANP